MTFAFWTGSRKFSRAFRLLSTQRPRIRQRQLRWARLRMDFLEDRTLLSPYLVTTTVDSGTGSLRDAITQVNADTSHTLYPSPGNPSVDEIDFNITAASDTGGGYNATTGVATITPQSALPAVTSAVLINGYAQAGASPNTLSQGDNAVLKVLLNGVSAGPGVNGLNVLSTNVTVKGFDIVSFSGGGINVTGAGGDTIQGNYVGTNISGTGAGMPAGLVSWWLANGNASDSVGNNNGTLVGYQTGDTAFVPGQGGQAFNFDGTDDSVTVPDAPNLEITGSVSVGAWVKVGALNPFESWLAGKAGGAANYQLDLTSDGRALFAIFNAGTASYVGAFGSTHLTPGVYYNLAGTYDQATGTLSVYVNGVLDGTNNVAPGTVDSYPGGQHGFQIGGLQGFGYPNNPQLFTGQIGDVSLYNRALSPAEIQTITTLMGAVSDSNGTGFVVSSSGNTIGGITPGTGNVISGNTMDGVEFYGNGNYQGNRIKMGKLRKVA